MGGYTGIVLAAGFSSRMGALKPLLDAGGRTFLQRCISAFTQVQIDDVVVVTGHEREKVGAAARESGARVVHNERYESGMYSSVQAGVRAVPGDADGFFLLPVDCPLVRAETVGLLARARLRAGVSVVVPARSGRPGHPPLVAAELIDEILRSEPAGGLRALLHAPDRPVLLVDVDDPGVSHDADTPAAAVVVDSLARREDLPSEARCLELLDEHAATVAVVAHSRAVAGLAAALTVALNEHDMHLCLPLVVTSALLHDIARAEPRHDEAGARLVDALGFPRVARVVRRHMDVGELAPDLDEAQIVYLADKLVEEDRFVGLQARFAARLDGLHDIDAVREKVRARQAQAESVLLRVQRVLGHRLDSLYIPA